MLRRRLISVALIGLLLLGSFGSLFGPVGTARADEPSRRFFFPMVSTTEPVLGQEEPGSDPSVVMLPAPRGGLAFPQPSRTVGLASGGADLVAKDLADRVEIAPNSFVMRPGEERFLGVWVADEAGNRYAGDPSYLDLVLFNPGGYQVAWAGPGRIRVKAPDAFRPDPLVINVRRMDLTAGRRFLNGIANATMVVPKAETAILPEPLVGLPTTYTLDRGTLIARLNLFTREEWQRATNFELPEGSTDRPRFPVLLKEDPSIDVNALRGRFVTSFGEAFFLGKVQEVVARRNGFALVAVQPAFPWEVLSMYRDELDLEPVINAGIVPVDGASFAKSFKELEAERSVQGLADELKRRCKFKPLEIDTAAKFTIGEVPLPQVKFGAALPFECSLAKNSKGRVLGFDGKVGLVFSAKASAKTGQVKGELIAALSGQLKLVWESPDGFKLEGDKTPGWLFNLSAPAWNDPIFNVNVEFGLGDINSLASFKPEKGKFEDKAVLASITGKLEGGAKLSFDSKSSEFIRLSPHFKGGIETSTPFFSTSGSSAKGEATFELESALFGMGVVLGVGGAWTNSIGSLLNVLGIKGDMSSLVGVGATVFPVVPSLEWKYITRTAALGESSKRGGILLNAKRKIRVQARGALLQALEQGTAVVAKFRRGIDIDAGSWYAEPVRLAGATPVFVQARDFRERVTIVGEWSGMPLRRVEAWRAADAKDPSAASPLAVREGSLRQSVTVQLDRPKDCDSLPSAEREVILVGETEIPFLPVAFGWFQIGKVDICKSLSLRVPAARALVGQTARAEGTLSYSGQASLNVDVQSSVVQAQIGRPTIEPGEGSVTVNFSCQQEGSFVGQVRVNEAGRPGDPLAESPAVVTCLRGPENPPPNNPPANGGTQGSSIDRFVGWSDPHLVTLDGAAYDFHARGEFWGSIHPGMPFQLRFFEMLNNARASYIGRLAAKSGNSIVEISPFRDHRLRRSPALQVLVNGSDRLDDLRELGHLALDSDGYVAVVRWVVVQDGSQRFRYPLEVVVVYPGANPRPSLSVRADSVSGADFLGISAALPAQFAGQLSGLMGNGNGTPTDDFVTRDGQRLTAPLSFGVLYEVFGRSWEVRPEESFFSDGRIDSIYPVAPPEINPVRAQEAEAFCNGISNEFIRRACILDAAVTGDPAAAAQIARDVDTSYQALGASVSAATRGARLGLSPVSIAVNRSSEATITVANPSSDVIRYRLHLVGSGPGLQIDGITLPAGGFANEWSVDAGAARTHRIGAVCSAAEEHVYLLSAVERDAAESRTVLVLVDCRQALTIQASPGSLSVDRGQSGAVQVTLQRENLSGPVNLSLSSTSAPLDPIPAPDKISWTFAPNPSVENSSTLTVTVGAGVATGAYQLAIRATIESGSVVSQTLVLTVTEPPVPTGWRVAVPAFLTNLATANDQLVALGPEGIILTSSDGATWEPQVTPVGKDLLDIAAGNGKLVVVASGDTVLTSVDGRSWIARSVEFTTNVFRIVFGNGRFVIPERVNRIHTSPDGENWTSIRVNLNGRVNDLTFGNGRFVAVGEGFVASSTDGETWTKTSMSVDLVSVAFFGGQFHALSEYGAYFTSANGETWSQQPTPWPSLYWSADRIRIRAAGSYLVAETVDHGVYATTDGRTWTLLWTHPDYDVVGTAAKNGELFLLFSGGAVISSRDLRAWVHRFGPLNFRFNYEAMTHFNGRYWVATESTILEGESPVHIGMHILSSPDGRAWTLMRPGFNEHEDPKHLLGGNGRLILVTSENRIFSSQDGLTWTLRFNAPTEVRGITFSHGKFVAVGYNMVLTSVDGESWTTVSAPNLSFTGVTGGRNPLNADVFVAVSASGHVVTSSDGTSWSIDAQLSAQLYGVAYGQGRFVAVGANGWNGVNLHLAEWYRLDISGCTHESVLASHYRHRAPASLPRATKSYALNIRSNDGVQLGASHRRRATFVVGHQGNRGRAKRKSAPQ
ncbi:MAG: hypothetical protein KatS3mg060_1116 [Dehalococcoidia bacterium]|nr:MAG: hypothetical protein KatS3mg060_1116 [Dehalococcoidia bacterium]